MTKESDGKKTGHLRHGLSSSRKLPEKVFEFTNSKVIHFQKLLEVMVMAKSGAEGLTAASPVGPVGFGKGCGAGGGEAREGRVGKR